MPRVVHFEIYADQPERAAKFYSDVFGWRFQRTHLPVEYWLITTGQKEQPGIDGGLARRAEGFTSTINYIDVPSVDDFMAKIAGNGGSVISPKITIPGVGYMALCRDTEGNTFGIFNDDPSAQ